METISYSKGIGFSSILSQYLIQLDPREANAVTDRLTKRGVEKDYIFVGSLEEEIMM